MAATLRYILITTLRDRIVLAISLALLAATGIGAFFGAAALAEGRQLGLAYGGEISRFVLALGLIAFVSFHIRRMHETREIEAILARPISRASFVFACFLAYAFVAVLLALETVPLMMLVFGAQGAGFLVWEASLLLECCIIIAMALFCSMALSSAGGALLASFGFYAFGRSAMFFFDIARNGTGATYQGETNQALNGMIDVLASLAPRLDLFGQSQWLIYGPGGGWGIGTLLLQTAIYVPLLLGATIRDLQIKRF